MSPPAFNVSDVPQLIAAVGALGFAAMGLVEAVGKGLLVFDSLPRKLKQKPWGLPYAGYGSVKRFIQKVAPALEVSYGDRYAAVIINQYKAGRGSGQAPDTIRQGVRLGLPYLNEKDSIRVIGAVWGMAPELTAQFAASLRVPAPGTPAPDLPVPIAQSLAARFATALDTRVQGAFDSAEQDYQAWARVWAGIAAVALSLAYNAATTPTTDITKPGGWVLALIVGLVAVPLAPVAKDLSSSLSQALAALGQIRAKTKS